MDDYASLCERIKDHCHQKQWYGPDIYHHHTTFNRHPNGPWIKHDFRASFFPPATEENLRLSEEVMGFPYPPLLRTLYSQVANGGFGPAYGLIGAFCGYEDAMYKDEQHEYILQDSIVQTASPNGLLKTFRECYHSMHRPERLEYILQDNIIQAVSPNGWNFIDLEQYEKQYGDPKVIDIGPYVWPSIWSKHFICLCEWGCGSSSYLHAQNGYVYYKGEGRLYRQADSLEEWLERWQREEDLTERILSGELEFD